MCPSIKIPHYIVLLIALNIKTKQEYYTGSSIRVHRTRPIKDK